MPTYHIAPKDQGQIVEVAYASVGDYVIRRILDRSDRSVAYSISRRRVADEGDYWNAPPRNRRWRHITESEATALGDE